MDKLRKIALIVAAGSGSRMGMITPKQFHPVGGIPLAVHPGLKFREAFPDMELIYVIGSGTAQIWENFLTEYFPEGNWRLCMGGKTRYDSVRNGIRSIQDEDAWVAVHDGARPFISAAEIRQGFNIAIEKGNAVFGVPVKDSLRQLGQEGESHFLDRSSIMLVQTPQIFRLSEMRPAYLPDAEERFTDDATVMEIAGHRIFLCQGNYDNLKVTTQEDWIIAEKILQKRIRQSDQHEIRDEGSAI